MVFILVANFDWGGSMSTIGEYSIFLVMKSLLPSSLECLRIFNLSMTSENEYSWQTCEGFMIDTSLTEWRFVQYCLFSKVNRILISTRYARLSVSGTVKEQHGVRVLIVSSHQLPVSHRGSLNQIGEDMNRCLLQVCVHTCIYLNDRKMFWILAF